MGRHFRTGRKVGRTVYRQRSDDPADGEDLVGMLDTRELAAFAVEAMNQALDRGLEPGGEGETR